MQFRNNSHAPIRSPRRPLLQRAWVRVLSWLAIQTVQILFKLFILEPFIWEATKQFL